MATNTVGIQARGHAGVFNQSPNFWRYVQANQQKQAHRQEMLARERKLRDDLVSDAMKFNPGDVWKPFYSELEDYVQSNVRDYVLDARDRGLSMGQIQRELAQRQGGALKLKNQINHYQDVHKEMFSKIEQEEKQGFFQPGYYRSKLNDYFFNGRQAKSVSEIDTEGIEEIFNDSKGYNLSVIASDFVKNLAPQMTEKYRRIASDLGEQFDVSIVKSKLGVMMKEDGTPDLDPITGQPKIQMTDDVAMMAMENPYLRNYVIDNLGANPDKEKVKDLLAPILAPYDPRSVQKQRRQGHKYTQEDRDSRSGYTVPEQLVADRYDTLYRITHEYDPELLASLLPGLEDVSISYEVYGPGEAKKHPPRIVATFPNPKYNPGSTPDPKANPRVIRKTMSLETEEGRQTAMEFLNTILDDKLDAKQRIGENFTRYRKKKRGEMKDAGGFYQTDQPAANDGAAGWYQVPQ